MQYGHCVVSATATAINSLYFTGMAPSATAALSNAQNAVITSGARLFIFLILARFSFLYMSSISQVVAIRQRDFRPALDSRIVLAMFRRIATDENIHEQCESFQPRENSKS